MWLPPSPNSQDTCFFFLLDLFFIYISSVVPFPGFPHSTPKIFAFYCFLFSGSLLDSLPKAKSPFPFSFSFSPEWQEVQSHFLPLLSHWVLNFLYWHIREQLSGWFLHKIEIGESMNKYCSQIYVYTKSMFKLSHCAQ